MTAYDVVVFVPVFTSIWILFRGFYKIGRGETFNRASASLALAVLYGILAGFTVFVNEALSMTGSTVLDVILTFAIIYPTMRLFFFLMDVLVRFWSWMSRK